MQIVGELDRIGPDRFADFVTAQTPVVIEGAIADWPALAKWTPSYLAGRVGDAPVRWKLSPNGAHPNFHAATMKEMFATGAGTFREFLAEAAADRAGRVLFTGDEKFLLRRRDGVTTVDPDFAPLLDDVRVPALVPADRLYTVWSWFSGSGGRTWLHYDNNGCHNLNAQLAGEKTCVLLAPEEVEKVALFPIGGANPAKNCSQIDLGAPDLARFPAFGSARALAGRLRAGDLLFIPAWWLHAFDHVGTFNANVNFWWKPVEAVANAVSRHQAAIDAAATPRQ